jgi:3-methyl-2-oxobutanoate hydroxymethyltransferase
VQGKLEASAQKIVDDTLALQQAGCFSVVLECIPSALAKRITSQVELATIGIGAGPDTDGQVLVLQDLLGMNKNFNPKFLKKFTQGFDLISQALNDYAQEVEAETFPAAEHQYE